MTKLASKQPRIIHSPVDLAERGSLDLRPGDTVRVHMRIVEKGKTRLQVFEGLVLARKHGSEAGATFTVRKVASGVGMERVFPLYSPNIAKIEIVKRSTVRRSKLYYIRSKAAKEVSKKMRELRGFVRTTVADENKPKPAPDTSVATEEEMLPETPAESEVETTAETKE